MENLNLYHIFYTVAKTGNISKAANQLYISQPAVSKATHKLEEEIGTTLFNRSSRGVTLTDEGKVLFDYVERAFENLAKGEEHIRKYNELGLGHIRIGVSTSLCKHILLDYLKDFIKDNPHIKVSIDCHATINTLNLLKNDEIDIGLICDTELPKGTVYKPIKEIHDIFIANSDYIDNFHLREYDNFLENPDALPKGISGNLTGNLIGNISSLIPDTYTAKKISADNIKEILEKSNLMVLEEANITRNHVDNYLMSQNIHCEQILEINNMDLLIDFAAIGMGVASVVREFALDYLNSGQVIELPLPVPIEKRTVGFAYLQGKSKSTALNKFLEYCGI